MDTCQPPPPQCNNGKETVFPTAVLSAEHRSAELFCVVRGLLHFGKMRDGGESSVAFCEQFASYFADKTRSHLFLLGLGFKNWDMLWHPACPALWDAFSDYTT